MNPQSSIIWWIEVKTFTYLMVKSILTKFWKTSQNVKSTGDLVFHIDQAFLSGVYKSPSTYIYRP